MEGKAGMREQGERKGNGKIERLNLLAAKSCVPIANGFSGWLTHDGRMSMHPPTIGYASSVGWRYFDPVRSVTSVPPK